MDKEEFKRILKTSQLCVSINPFDFDEESARYRMSRNGDVYELFPIDNTEEFLFNINDEKKLQKLYDDVLCNVVNYSYTEHC